MASHQENLFDPPFKTSLEFGVGHYVPILKSLAGERRALEQMAAGAPDARRRLTPLVEARDPIPQPPRERRVVANEFADEGDSDAWEDDDYEIAYEVEEGAGPARKKPSGPRNYLRGLPDQLLPMIGKFSPFYLDFPTTPSDRLMTGRKSKGAPVNAIEYVYDACRARHLWFIPVLAVGADDGRAALVRVASQTDRRGVCLRLPLLATVYSDRRAGTLGVGDRVARMLAELKASPGDVDLILELRQLDPAGGVTAEFVARAFDEIANLKEFRNVILTGTSVPNTSAGLARGQITYIARQEWTLYTLLRKISGRVPTFGDYGVQNPDGPKAGGIPIPNLRYTTTPDLLYSLGENNDRDTFAEQFRRTCRQVIESGRFRGEDYSLADLIIARTPADRKPRVDQGFWRGLGTLHHLTQVIEDLKQLDSEPATR